MKARKKGGKDGAGRGWERRKKGGKIKQKRKLEGKGRREEDGRREEG